MLFLVGCSRAWWAGYDENQARRQCVALTPKGETSYTWNPVQFHVTPYPVEKVQAAIEECVRQNYNLASMATVPTVMMIDLSHPGY